EGQWHWWVGGGGGLGGLVPSRKRGRGRLPPSRGRHERNVGRVDTLPTPCVPDRRGRCRYFFFSSRRRHTRSKRDWSSDVCSSDLPIGLRLRHYRPNGERQHIGAIMSGCEDAELHPPRGLSNLYGILSVSGGSRNLSGRSEERRVGKECRCGW